MTGDGGEEDGDEQEGEADIANLRVLYNHTGRTALHKEALLTRNTDLLITDVDDARAGRLSSFVVLGPLLLLSLSPLGGWNLSVLHLWHKHTQQQRAACLPNDVCCLSRGPPARTHTFYEGAKDNRARWI